MIGLLARLLGGIVTPLLDQISASGVRLARKLALLLVAALSLLVVLFALTMAFELWVASRAGHIVGALAVAAVYLVVAGVSVGLALGGGKTRRRGGAGESKDAHREDAAARDAAADARIDTFAEPLLAMLQRLGLRREQLAVLAGTSVAKQLGPIPLVSLAIVAGFLIGRMGAGLKNFLRADLLAGLLSSDLLAAFFRAPQNDDERGEA